LSLLTLGWLVGYLFDSTKSQPYLIRKDSNLRTSYGMRSKGPKKIAEVAAEVAADMTENI
jgi:hypothetical protein